MNDNIPAENFIDLVERGLKLIRSKSIQRSNSDGTTFEWAYAPKEKINWDQFDELAYADFRFFKDFPTIEAVCVTLDRALRRLGDHRSYLTHPKYWSTIKSAGKPDERYFAEHDLSTDDRFTWRFEKENGFQTSSRSEDVTIHALALKKEEYVVSGEDRLHITSPGFPPGTEAHWEEFVKAIREKLLPGRGQGDPPKGVIVDLRKDSGGSMGPMLWALSPLLGPGDLGFFCGPTTFIPWTCHYLRSDGYVLTDDDENYTLTDIPVGVLVGRETAGAGEAIMLSFRGRPNTQIFGQATRGESSRNATFPLSYDGELKLYICDAVYLDRDRRGSGGGRRDRLEPGVDLGEEIEQERVRRKSQFHRGYK